MSSLQLGDAYGYYGDVSWFSPMPIATLALYIVLSTTVLRLAKRCSPLVGDLSFSQQRKLSVNILELVLNCIWLPAMLIRGWNLLFASAAEGAWSWSDFAFCRGAIVMPMMIFHLWKLAFRLNTQLSLTVHHITLVFLAYFGVLSVYALADSDNENKTLLFRYVLLLLLTNSLIGMCFQAVFRLHVRHPDQFALLLLILKRLKVRRPLGWYFRAVTYQMGLCRLAGGVWLLVTWIHFAVIGTSPVYVQQASLLSSAWKYAGLPVTLFCYLAQAQAWSAVLLAHRRHKRQADRGKADGDGQPNEVPLNNVYIGDPSAASRSDSALLNGSKSPHHNSHGGHAASKSREFDDSEMSYVPTTKRDLQRMRDHSIDQDMVVPSISGITPHSRDSSFHRQLPASAGSGHFNGVQFTHNPLVGTQPSPIMNASGAGAMAAPPQRSVTSGATTAGAVRDLARTADLYSHILTHRRLAEAKDDQENAKAALVDDEDKQEEEDGLVAGARRKHSNEEDRGVEYSVVSTAPGKSVLGPGFTPFGPSRNGSILVPNSYRRPDEELDDDNDDNQSDGHGNLLYPPRSGDFGSPPSSKDNLDDLPDDEDDFGKGSRARVTSATARLQARPAMSAAEHNMRANKERQRASSSGGKPPPVVAASLSPQQQERPSLKLFGNNNDAAASPHPPAALGNFVSGGKQQGSHRPSPLNPTILQQLRESGPSSDSGSGRKSKIAEALQQPHSPNSPTVTIRAPNGQIRARGITEVAELDSVKLPPASPFAAYMALKSIGGDDFDAAPSQIQLPPHAANGPQMGNGAPRSRDGSLRGSPVNSPSLGPRKERPSLMSSPLHKAAVASIAADQPNQDYFSDADSEQGDPNDTPRTKQKKRHHRRHHKHKSAGNNDAAAAEPEPEDWTPVLAPVPAPAQPPPMPSPSPPPPLPPDAGLLAWSELEVRILNADMLGGSIRGTGKVERSLGFVEMSGNESETLSDLRKHILEELDRVPASFIFVDCDSNADISLSNESQLPYWRAIIAGVVRIKAVIIPAPSAGKLEVAAPAMGSLKPSQAAVNQKSIQPPNKVISDEPAAAVSVKPKPKLKESAAAAKPEPAPAVAKPGAAPAGKKAAGISTVHGREGLPSSLDLSTLETGADSDDEEEVFIKPPAKPAAATANKDAKPKPQSQVTAALPASASSVLPKKSAASPLPSGSPAKAADKPIGGKASLSAVTHPSQPGQASVGAAKSPRADTPGAAAKPSPSSAKPASTAAISPRAAISSNLQSESVAKLAPSTRPSPSPPPLAVEPVSPKSPSFASRLLQDPEFRELQLSSPRSALLPSSTGRPSVKLNSESNQSAGLKGNKSADAPAARQMHDGTMMVEAAPVAESRGSAMASVLAKLTGSSAPAAPSASSSASNANEPSSPRSANKLNSKDPTNNGPLLAGPAMMLSESVKPPGAARKLAGIDVSPRIDIEALVAANAQRFGDQNPIASLLAGDIATPRSRGPSRGPSRRNSLAPPGALKRSVSSDSVRSDVSSPPEPHGRAPFLAELRPSRDRRMSIDSVSSVDPESSMYSVSEAHSKSKKKKKKHKRKSKS